MAPLLKTKKNQLDRFQDNIDLENERYQLFMPYINSYSLSERKTKDVCKKLRSHNLTKPVLSRFGNLPLLSALLFDHCRER